MTPKESHFNKSNLDAWLESKTKTLSTKQLVILFSKAFNVVQERTLKTLSLISFLAITDRALHQTKKKFPVLSPLKLESSKRIEWEQLLSSFNDKNVAELLEALRAFLHELINILGKLTGDTLSQPLYKELRQVLQPNTNSNNENKKTNFSEKSKDGEDL